MTPSGDSPGVRLCPPTLCWFLRGNAVRVPPGGGESHEMLPMSRTSSLVHSVRARPSAGGGELWVPALVPSRTPGGLLWVAGQRPWRLINNSLAH